MSSMRFNNPARSPRQAIFSLPYAILAGAAILFAVSACGGSSPTAPESPPDGAVFRVEVTGETFHILIQDPERIAEAEAILTDGVQRWIAGRLRRGDGGFNRPWSWHIDPATVEFSVVCPARDSRPSQVEANLDLWIDRIMFYCDGRLVARVR